MIAKAGNFSISADSLMAAYNTLKDTSAKDKTTGKISVQLSGTQINYTNENGVGVLLIEDGQAVDLCGSECSIRDFSDEELLRELKRRGINLIDKKNVIDILKTAQIVTAKTNGFIDGFVSQIWVINDLLRKVIEKLGGEAYKVEQDGSIEYDDSENEKIKEFKEEK